MRILAVCAVVSLALATAPQFRADPPAAKLPKDGTWFRYFVTETTDDRDDLILTLTLSFVGSTSVNGQACRWIELKLSGTIEGEDITEINKLLIPEERLLKSDKPLDQPLRGWKWDSNGRGDKVFKSAGVSGIFAEQMAPFFPGAAALSKQTDEHRVVAFQKGRLTIPKARSGQRRSRPRPSHLRYDYSVWRHKEIPFGPAAARVKTSVMSGDKVRQTFTWDVLLEDFGTGAKTALPEHN